MTLSRNQPLVLLSQSPRRRELLEQLGIPIRVTVPSIDESAVDHETPKEMVARLAHGKLIAGIEKDASAWCIYLAADTVVVLKNRVLGKPRDATHALEILHALEGTSHVVATGFALHEVASGRTHLQVVETRVEFRRVPPAWLHAYAHSSEPMDKAGAYAIQGMGSFLVRSIVGSWPNVVGLPVVEVLEVLERWNALEGFPGGLIR